VASGTVGFENLPGFRGGVWLSPSGGSVQEHCNDRAEGCPCALRSPPIRMSVRSSPHAASVSHAPLFGGTITGAMRRA
jgi:hypothetical protein